jgi:hypothetical protein
MMKLPMSTGVVLEAPRTLVTLHPVLLNVVKIAQFDKRMREDRVCLV